MGLIKRRSLVYVMLIGAACSSGWAEDKNGYKFSVESRDRAVLDSEPPPSSVPATRVILLEEAYDRALATDQSVEIAFREIQKSKLLPWSSLTLMTPRLTGNMSYSNTQGSSTQKDRVESKSADITYFQPLFEPRIFPTYKIGKLSDKIARLQHQFTRREVLFGVAKGYYEILKQQKLVEIARQTLDVASKQLDLSQKRYDAGDVTRTDVLRARVSVETARRSVIETENNLEVARTALSNVLNLGGGTNFQIVEPESLKWEETSLETILGRAYQQREDYEVAVLAVDQDIERRSQVVADYFPTVGAQLRDRWTDPHTTRDNPAWDASISVQVPFFEGGQRELDLKTASEKIEQTRLNREKLYKSIHEEVKSAWLLVHTLGETLKTLKSQAEAAEQTYKDLLTQYQSGAATSLDTLIALRDWNGALADLNTQISDYQVALRNLLRTAAEFETGRLNTTTSSSKRISHEK